MNDYLNRTSRAYTSRRLGDQIHNASKKCNSHMRGWCADQLYTAQFLVARLCAVHLRTVCLLFSSGSASTTWNTNTASVKVETRKIKILLIKAELFFYKNYLCQDQPSAISFYINSNNRTILYVKL